MHLTTLIIVYPTDPGVKIKIDNRTTHRIDVQCENRPLVCGEWTKQLPRNIDGSQHVEGKVSCM